MNMGADTDAADPQADLSGEDPDGPGTERPRATEGLADLVGLTALVEHGQIEETALVTATGPGTITVTCDEPAWGDGVLEEALLSVFAPDALYQVSGPVTVEGLTVTSGDASSVQRIQRRKWSRRRLDLAVTVCPTSDGRRVEGIPGRTVDLGLGGLCVETLREVEGEGDPMIILSLPDGTAIVAGTTTVAVEDLGDGWRYRLAFQGLDAHDAGRLAEITS